MYFIIFTWLFVYPSLSYSTIRVLCAGKVLVDRTQPQTHQGYQELTSLPPPHPLPPPTHLAMRTLPVTHRFSPSAPTHIWYTTNWDPTAPLHSWDQDRLNSTGQYEWRGTLNFLADYLFSHHSSPCVDWTRGPTPAAIVAECLRRRDWVVFKEDPERLWIT